MCLCALQTRCSITERILFNFRKQHSVSEHSHLLAIQMRGSVINHSCSLSNAVFGDGMGAFGHQTIPFNHQMLPFVTKRSHLITEHCVQSPNVYQSSNIYHSVSELSHLLSERNIQSPITPVCSPNTAFSISSVSEQSPNAVFGHRMWRSVSEHGIRSPNAEFAH